MSGKRLSMPAGRLPPTTESLLDDNAKPYFLRGTETTAVTADAPLFFGFPMSTRQTQ